MYHTLRKEVTEADILTVASILDSSHRDEALPTQHLHVCTEALKLLRNLCVGLPSNQAFIMQVLP